MLENSTNDSRFVKRDSSLMNSDRKCLPQLFFEKKGPDVAWLPPIHHTQHCPTHFSSKNKRRKKYFLSPFFLFYTFTIFWIMYVCGLFCKWVNKWATKMHGKRKPTKRFNVLLHQHYADYLHPGCNFFIVKIYVVQIIRT